MVKRIPAYDATIRRRPVRVPKSWVDEHNLQNSELSFVMDETNERIYAFPFYNDHGVPDRFADMRWFEHRKITKTGPYSFSINLPAEISQIPGWAGLLEFENHGALLEIRKF